MARRTKLTAVRRKRRWIGLKISKNIVDRSALADALNGILEQCNSWRIYDFEISGGADYGFAIIRVDRRDEKYVRSILHDEKSGIKSCTTSGKIKLVRERLFS